MTTLRLVLADQLDRDVAALADLDAGTDVVLLAEVAEETTYVPHHRQKIALLFSAMRHFAEALAEDGVTVDYVRLDDPDSSGSLGGEVARAVARHGAKQVVVTEPGEWRVRRSMDAWAGAAGVPVEIRADDRFLCSRERFRRWIAGRKAPRMEHFYRDMRRLTGLLMDGDAPAGGRWNFDTENRGRLPKEISVPPRPAFPPDAATREVVALVAARFPDGFGDLEPFDWPVTREQATAALDAFIADHLPSFGDYQDAMKRGEPALFHARLSAALNMGLLRPMEVCRAAEATFRDGAAPLNAVEGFVRQILGWREYVRGLYWQFMPDYAQTNALGASRPLPGFYWTGETDMACIAEVVGEIRRSAYAHHIQRLMVTGNFALLAGLAPAEVEEWYLAVFADAYEWVELPNTHGMALFADGGVMGSKPYAASGAYIDRMSDYCGPCRFDPKVKAGPDACPFNPLYWNFLDEHRATLGANPRLAMPYRTLDRMDARRRAEIRADAARILAAVEAAPRWLPTK